MTYSLPAHFDSGRPKSGAAFADDSYGIVDFLKIAYRRKLLILTTILTVMVATVISVSRMDQVYTASTSIMIERRYGAGSSSAIEELRIASIIEILKSREIAQKVLEKTGIVGQGEFGGSIEKSESSIDRLLEFVGTRLGTRAYLSDAPSQKARGKINPPAHVDPKLERAIATLIDRIQIRRVPASRIVNVSVVSRDPVVAAALANQLVDTKAEEDLQATLDFKLRNRERLEAALEILTKDAYEAEYAVYQFANENAEYIAVESPLLVQLRKQEVDLSIKLAELSAYYGPGYPEVESVSAQLSAVRDQILNESTQELVQQKQSNLKHTVKGEKSSELANLQADARAKRNLYDAFLERLRALERSVEPDFPDFTVISRAAVPLSPSAPRPNRILAVAFMGSVGLAFVLALAAEAMTTRDRAPRRVDRSMLHVPALAVVPRLTRLPGGRDLGTAVRDNPSSHHFGPLRDLYIELVAQPSGSVGRIVVMTSVLPKAGTTTISEAVAAIAEENGCSAIAVNLDRIDLAVSRMFQKPLLGSQDEGEIDVETMPQTGNLVTSRRLPALLQELRKRFDLVIFDAPPILQARDAKAIAAYADATVLVVDEAKTPAVAFAAAEEILGHYLTGAVFNRAS